MSVYTEIKKLRIGLLLNDRALEYWEYLIFYSLFSDSRIEIVVLIQDGSSYPARIENFKKMGFAQSIRHIFRQILANFCFFVERKRLPTRTINDALKTFVDCRLKRLERMITFPEKKGFVDRFNEKELDYIRQKNLDVILRHQFGILKGSILNVATYGIWSFHHADNDINRGGPTGFWEVYYKHPVTGVTLQRLTEELDGDIVIDKGYYSTLSTWYCNKEYILEKSCELLKKNFEILISTGSHPQKISSNYSHKLFLKPSSFQLIKYMINSYGPIIWHHCKYRMGKTQEPWILHIGNGDILKATMWRSHAIIPPPDEFWADPFVVIDKGERYIFIENYEYRKVKAKISVIKINEANQLIKMDAIVTDYHLSYPQVIAFQNQYYMIPETSSNQRLEIWICETFPNKWHLLKTVFDGVNIADATLFNHPQSGYWLFANISYDSFNDHCAHCSHLYLFKVDSPLLNTLVPHALNPIVTDCRYARSGGEIFITDDGRIIRPSQRNIKGNYGSALNFNEIEKLSLSEYSEKPITTIYPNFSRHMKACHHYSGNKAFWCIDARYKTLSHLKKQIKHNIC